MIFDTAQSTDTPLTANSYSTCSALGDLNNTTYVYLKYNNSFSYWTGFLSMNNLTAKVPVDCGNAVVTLEKDLIVTYNPQPNNTYIVTVSGKIKDSGNEVELTGKTIGIFAASNPPK
jgi:hypothetical protein